MILLDTQLLTLFTAGALIVIGIFAAIYIDNIIKKSQEELFLFYFRE